MYVWINGPGLKSPVTTDLSLILVTEHKDADRESTATVQLGGAAAVRCGGAVPWEPGRRLLRSPAQPQRGASRERTPRVRVTAHVTTGAGRSLPHGAHRPRW